MKTWNQLFIRQGFQVKETEKQMFDCRIETEENMEFLLESLQHAGAVFFYDGKYLHIESEPVSENHWIEVVDFQWRGISEGDWFRPGQEEPKIRELDTYISGMVRELNRLGLYTMGSCDGHGRREPFVSFSEHTDLELATKVLLAAGLKRVYMQNRKLSLHASREQLLDAVEVLHIIQKEWLNKGIDFLQQQLFYNLLEQLLSISGASGNERRVREFVCENLKSFVDYITIDRNGNILAQKTYRGGNGPTILLNAHLDTVEEFAPGRVIEKNGTIWSSSEGILGADDRAGVAVLLETARQLDSLNFSGTAKFIFTVEEEIGLVGAKKVDEYFLWDVDAAIVVDRRGTGDIVTSCGGYEQFCSERYGTFFEYVAEAEGLAGWKCRAGGSSDTRVWALHGIQSVNLSAGYQHEHTDAETLDVEACYQVVKIIQGVFRSRAELRRVLHEVRREERRTSIVRRVISKK